MHRSARRRARGAGASLVPELLYAPVLLRDLRLELVDASLRTLKDALHLGLVRERKRVIDRDAHALFGLFDLLLQQGDLRLQFALLGRLFGGGRALLGAVGDALPEGFLLLGPVGLGHGREASVRGSDNLCRACDAAGSARASRQLW